MKVATIFGELIVKSVADMESHFLRRQRETKQYYRRKSVAIKQRFDLLGLCFEDVKHRIDEKDRERLQDLVEQLHDAIDEMMYS